MVQITGKSKRNITFNNEIFADGVLVVGQQGTIDESLNSNVTQWISNMQLYEENRVAIREKIAEFEDMVLAEKNKYIAESTAI